MTCSYVSDISQNGVSARGGGVSITNLATLRIAHSVVPAPLPPMSHDTPIACESMNAVCWSYLSGWSGRARNVK